MWDTVRDKSPLTKALSFGVAVIQSVLVARQLFGSIGLSQWYPFNKVEIATAIEMIVSKMLRSSDSSEPLLEDLCYAIPQVSVVKYQLRTSTRRSVLPFHRLVW